MDILGKLFWAIACAVLASSDLQAAEFNRTFELQGIKFLVQSTNSGSINTVTIKPYGLTIDNAPIASEIEGVVTGVEVADLDSDGSPEIYVYIQSAGSGSYGSLIAYATNHKKTMSQIYLPDLMQDKTASVGYQGHDEFSVLESRLGRRFPIYRTGDTNSNPTGGLRQIDYKLIPGEAGWLLKRSEIHNFLPSELNRK